MPVRNSAAAGIVRTDFDGDPVAREDSDVELPHPAADGGKHHESIVTLHAKHRVRERLLDDAIELELIALRLFSLSTFAHVLFPYDPFLLLGLVTEVEPEGST